MRQPGRYCEHVSAAEETPQTPDETAAVPAEDAVRELRFAYVAGVTPGKWTRRWEERMPDVPLRSFMSDDGAQLTVLRDGSADLSFVRLPVDREGLSVIPLYEEQPVVVAPKGHEISVFEEVAFADLSNETFLDVAELGGPEMALQVVASGAGLVILPMSVARHFNVKGTVARQLTGAPDDGDRCGMAQRQHGRGDRGVHRDCPRPDRRELPPALRPAGKAQEGTEAGPARSRGQEAQGGAALRAQPGQGPGQGVTEKGQALGGCPVGKVTWRRRPAGP